MSLNFKQLVISKENKKDRCKKQIYIERKQIEKKYIQTERNRDANSERK